MAARDEDYAPIDFDNYVDFPRGIYLLWSELTPHPPLPLAKFCPGGCNGRDLQLQWQLFESLRLQFDLCYDSNTVHWTQPDGKLAHGLVIGPFFNQGKEKGEKAMGYVKALLERNDRDRKFRREEFHLVTLD